jgi:uncharacterized protein YsxB (DUF464 family)
MTNVEVRRNLFTSSQYRVRIRGHAGFEPGKDIVCAAVSILTYTLAQKLTDLQAEQKVVCGISMESGNAEFFVWVRCGHEQEFETVLDTIITGFELLAEKYPEHVSIVSSVDGGRN